MKTKRLSREARADLLLRAAACWQMGQVIERYCEGSPRWCRLIVGFVFWARDESEALDYHGIAASLALSEVCGMGYDLEDAESRP